MLPVRTNIVEDGAKDRACMFDALYKGVSIFSRVLDLGTSPCKALRKDTPKSLFEIFVWERAFHTKLRASQSPKSPIPVLSCMPSNDVSCPYGHL